MKKEELQQLELLIDQDFNTHQIYWQYKTTKFWDNLSDTDAKILDSALMSGDGSVTFLNDEGKYLNVVFQEPMEVVDVLTSQCYPLRRLPSLQWKCCTIATNGRVPVNQFTYTCLICKQSGICSSCIDICHEHDGKTKYRHEDRVEVESTCECPNNHACQAIDPIPSFSCSKEKNPSYFVQPVFRCFTCNPDNRINVYCDSCVKFCHRGHSVELVNENSSFKCDCTKCNINDQFFKHHLMKQTHLGLYKESLSKAFNSEDYFPDITFIFPDNKQILAHKVVLCSNEFLCDSWDVSNDKQDNVNLDFSYEAVYAVLEMMYKGEVSIANNELLERILEFLGLFHEENALVQAAHVLNEKNQYPCIYRHSNITIENMACNPMFSDIKFLIGGEVLHAHKVALCTTSEYYFSMFRSGMRELESGIVEINYEWPPETFAAFLKSLYCLDFQKALIPIEQFPNAFVDVLDFIDISSYYGQNYMKKSCLDMISRDSELEDIDPDGAAYLYSVINEANERPINNDFGVAMIESNSSPYPDLPVYFPLIVIDNNQENICSIIYGMKIHEIEKNTVAFYVDKDETDIDINIKWSTAEKKILGMIIRYIEINGWQTTMENWPDNLKRDIIWQCLQDIHSYNIASVLIKFAHSTNMKGAEIFFALILENLMQSSNVIEILLIAHNLRNMKLRGKCMDFLVSNMEMMVQREKNLPLENQKLATVSTLTQSISTTIMNRITVASTNKRKASSRCGICGKKQLKKIKTICEICNDFVCKSCINSEYCEVPPIFNFIESPIKPCIRCSELLYVTYESTKIVEKEDCLNGFVDFPNSSVDLNHPKHISYPMLLEYKELVKSNEDSKVPINRSRCAVTVHNITANDLSVKGELFVIVRDKNQNRIWKSYSLKKTNSPEWAFNSENFSARFVNNLSWCVYYTSFKKESFYGAVEFTPALAWMFQQESGMEHFTINFDQFSPINPKNNKRKKKCEGNISITLSVERMGT
eukprot:TRINITY_DN7500_c0_g1_i1.p1 TRINITY_DN7500_c0_g1~~TRINITY_DN7500_c0_g1_i1.p1  ORF type:complete len:989 (+),score=166.42 TRINITY_DN7500_c0_g1_i1:42-3008(+)